MRQFTAWCIKADPYPNVPWVDREGNLVYYPGYPKQDELPDFPNQEEFNEV